MAEPTRDWLDDPDEPVEEVVVTPEKPHADALHEQVRAVAGQRLRLRDLAAVLDEKRRAFDEANADLAAQIKAVKRELREGEGTLKTVALSRHRETGELQVAPGVKIRRTVSIEYADDDAISWARDHDEALPCLKLDRSKFNPLAKGLNLPFVRKETVSQVTLARDLDAALEGAA